MCLCALLTLPQGKADAGGLVGHWPLDDAKAAGHMSQGHAGGAMAFDGKRTLDVSAQASTLGALKDFTVSMWIQHRPGPSRMLLTWSDGTMAHRMQCEVHDGRLHFGWQNGGGWQSFATRPLAWKAGEWYHVAFINDSGYGKTIVRSNDSVAAEDGNTLAPASMRVEVTTVQIGGLNGGYAFTGAIDDVRVYDIPLSRADVRALYEGKPISGKPAARVPVAKLSALERDWLHQAERQPLVMRARQEIAWAEAMAARMGVRAPELAALKTQAAGIADEDVMNAWDLYVAVRKAKRTLMFQHPAIDFDEILFVDVPYTRGPEWHHESRYRSIMCAAHGGELVALKGLSLDGQRRTLAPTDGQAALLRPDLSYDGKRIVFCMKPEGEKAYHLYEMGIDGRGLRKLTSGSYSDLDPVYLPDGGSPPSGGELGSLPETGKLRPTSTGGIVFVTSRSNVFAGCGPWAPQHTLARCDADGKNIRLLSVASEPEYSPSVLDDGRLIYTRWEYNDKGLNRIQSLWTMNPDGTGSATYWGNQSTYPDHLGEARSIPGTPLVMFNGMGHHDMYRGCIGIVDTTKGLNFPDGLTKVTADAPWPEVGDGPVRTPPATSEYHTAGVYGGYKSPYPLSRELFLVSARMGNPGASSGRDGRRGLFKLYLMDIYGNRELVHQGRHNVLYAQPVRPRKRPPVLASTVVAGETMGAFYSADVYEGLPKSMRGKGKRLRVIECVQRNYTTGCVDGGGSPFGSGRNVALEDAGFLNRKPAHAGQEQLWGDGAILAGPAIAISSNTRLKRVLGTVPVAADGSFYFAAPAGKALYVQLLDENHLALQSMRSWVNLMPGERRGCVGCHEGRQNSPAAAFPLALARRQPDAITPPSWGVKTLSYVHDIQPIFDKNCAKCHQGDGKGRKKLDLTLRPDSKKRWGGIFPEPYITLTCGDNPVNNFGTGRLQRPTIAGNFFIWTETYATIQPMTRWSYKSRLINMHLHGKHNDVKLTKEEMGKLIVWVDTNCHYRSLADVLSIADPDPAWFGAWPNLPRLSSAPYVNHLVAQDRYNSPSDRPLLRDRMSPATPR